MGDTPQQSPSESGPIADADTVLSALKKTWAQGLTTPSTEDEGLLWVDPDLPVWGNIDPSEVS